MITLCKERLRKSEYLWKLKTIKIWNIVGHHSWYRQILSDKIWTFSFATKVRLVEMVVAAIIYDLQWNNVQWNVVAVKYREMKVKISPWSRYNLTADDLVKYLVK